MGFRLPRKLPGFADLKSTLTQSKSADDPLYQVVQELIERLSSFQFDVTPTNSTDLTGLATYQEGIWTPVFQGATTPATLQSYTTQKGNFVKIGKLVFCNYEINISSVGVGGAGILNLNGLPFPAGSIISSGYTYFFTGLNANIITAAEVVINAQSNMQFYVKAVASGTFEAQLTYANLQAGTRFISSFTYLTA